jgi:hypothetical protein
MDKIKFTCVVLIAVLMMASCGKDDALDNAPACIKEKIKQIESQAPRMAAVWQYDYNGQTVYYIPSDCCDQFNLLFDSECNVICSPDGGFSGGGDGRCTDFYAKAKNKTLIWEDKRK